MIIEYNYLSQDVITCDADRDVLIVRFQWTVQRHLFWISTAVIGPFCCLAKLFPKRLAVVRLSCCCVSESFASMVLELMFHYLD